MIPRWTRWTRWPRGPGAIALLGMALTLLPACTTPGERAERSVEVPMRETWASAADAGVPISSDWWRELADPALTALVEEALSHNVDLQAVAAQLLVAEAAVRVEGASLLPDLNLGLSRQRTKRNFIGFPTSAGGGATVTNISTNYGLGLSTSWEVDLWNRLASRESAAEQDALAAWADYAYARVSLSAAVLQAWFQLVEADRQVLLAEATRDTWEDNQALVSRRYAQGLRPALDARLVSVDLERARAEVARLARLRADAARVLERLLGRYPAGELAAAGELPTPSAPVPAGLPASLVSRRADLFAAERRLGASEFRVDAARADFYPQLVLTGEFGRSSEHLSDLLKGSFGVWQLLGSLVQPIFEGGRLRARLDGADAQAEVRLALFAGEILDALGEVEGALDAERRIAEEFVIRGRVAREAELASDLARRRYSEGLTDVTTMLDAQRNAYVADAALLVYRRLRLAARIELHLALGGGFTAENVPESAADARVAVLGTEAGDSAEAASDDAAKIPAERAPADEDDENGD